MVDTKQEVLKLKKGLTEKLFFAFEVEPHDEIREEIPEKFYVKLQNQMYCPIRNRTALFASWIGKDPWGIGRKMYGMPVSERK